MGIYDRDYERSYDTGSGWRDGGGYGGAGLGGGMAGWSANTKLLVTLVAVYVVQVVTLGEAADGRPAVSFVSEWFWLPDDWIRRLWRVYGLVTYGLLHDTQSIAHLLFNGITIFVFGSSLERRYGAREYIAFFFFAVIAGGVVWSLSEFGSGGGSSVLYGASAGAVACVVLFVLHNPSAQLLVWGVLPVPSWAVGTVCVLGDAFGAIERSGNVAHTAHLGGALFGYLYFRNGWRLAGWLPNAEGFKLPSLKRRPKLKVHVADDADESDDDRLDKILEKIQRSGQASLTRDEQRYLEEASRRAQQRRRG